MRGSKSCEWSRASRGVTGHRDQGGRRRCHCALRKVESGSENIRFDLILRPGSGPVAPLPYCPEYQEVECQRLNFLLIKLTSGLNGRNLLKPWGPYEKVLQDARGRSRERASGGSGESSLADTSLENVQPGLSDHVGP